MPDQSETSADRVDRIVSDLLAGRRLRVGPGDAADAASVMAAARLAAARAPYPRLSPAFRRRLAATLQAGRTPGQRAPILSRRSALVAGLGAIVGAAGATGVAGASRLFGPRGGALPAGDAQSPLPASLYSTTRIEPHPGRWFDAGDLAALPEGQAVRFQAGAVGAFLFRRGGEVRALSSMCTHLPCELQWRAADHHLVCPCHGQAFDVMGESISDSYPLPTLPTVQVRVVGGRVEVLGA